MAAQTHEAFASFAKHLSEESSGSWRVSQCLAFLQQKLSVALHSAISEATARQFAECVRIGVATTQSTCYRDVRLLVLPKSVEKRVRCLAQVAVS